MFRRTNLLLRITLSAVLVFGVPLGTFQSAEARTKCAEQIASEENALGGGRIARNDAVNVSVDAARSSAHAIRAVYQNAVDCLSECLEDSPSGSLALASSADPDKSKKYTSSPSIDHFKLRSEITEYVALPPTVTLPEDTILRTMRWRI